MMRPERVNMLFCNNDQIESWNAKIKVYLDKFIIIEGYGGNNIQVFIINGANLIHSASFCEFSEAEHYVASILA